MHTRPSSKGAESARIRWTLPPPSDRAPEIEPPKPLLKLKEMRISTVSHKDSVGNQLAPWAYNIGAQSRQNLIDIYIYIYIYIYTHTHTHTNTN